MESRDIHEALKTLEGIKEFFREKTKEKLARTKLQFLVWGMYQLVVPFVVYYTHNWLYFLLLLPVFFFLSLIRSPRVILSFLYWTLSLILYAVIIKAGSIKTFYLVFLVTIFVGFWIFSPRESSKDKLSGFFWMNTIVFALLFQMAIFHVRAYPLLYFSWPAIIVFALGSIGVLGEISLLYMSMIANIMGAVYFAYAPSEYRIFTMALYGTIYILYFLYLTVKLKESYG